MCVVWFRRWTAVGLAGVGQHAGQKIHANVRDDFHDVGVCEARNARMVQLCRLDCANSFGEAECELYCDIGTSIFTRAFTIGRDFIASEANLTANVSRVLPAVFTRMPVGNSDGDARTGLA